MRTGSCRIALLILSLFLAGCPLLNNGNRTFTSADTGQNSIFDGAGAEGDAEGEAPSLDDGETPREVVEPDVIRRQDNLLYVLNQYRGLTIVDLDTDTLLAQVPTQGYPRDLYFAGGQAYVLVGYAQDVTIQEGGAVGVSNSSRLYAVDVSDPANAAIRSSLDLPGDLVDSRLVGDILYAVSAEYEYGYYEDIAFVENATSTTVTSVDVSNPDAMVAVDQLAFEGSGNVVQVTPEFAFVAAPDWRTNDTAVTCLDIRDSGGVLVNAGTVQVTGYVDDRFKLDAWDGALRVVSSAWEGGNQVYLTTFDLADAALPRLAELRIAGAEGETLFATRFDGPRAYVVTFLVVDPLFVVDVADPAAPSVLGALEVPGYSTYIQPQGDRLIALGVDNTAGQKVSMSLFDVSGDAAPSLVDRVSFGGDWAWSNAYSDVKSLTILDDVIIVPFTGWSGYAGGFDRLQFISYTADSLQLRGAIDLSGSILRSFEYDAYYYGVTTEQVTRIDGSNLDAPAAVASVTIAENVVDYFEMSESLGVEVVARYDEGQLLLRTVDGDGAPLGELVIDAGEYMDAYPAGGDTLVVAGIEWENEPSYAVTVVDLAEPATPVIRHEIPVSVYPYYYYFYYYDGWFGGPEIAVPGGSPGVEEDAAKDLAYGFPYYFGDTGERGFLMGDVLALRCTANRYDATLGDETAHEGLALINIETGEWESTVGLGYTYLVSLHSAGGKLFASTKDAVSILPFQRPMASYYVREIDVVDLTEGPAANVPGALVQYDSASDVLTLRDYQWGAGGEVEQSLETVRWNGGTTVTRLDSLSVPAYSSRTLATGDRVYFDSYGSEYSIYQAVVAADGDLSLSEPVSVPGAYGNLIGAQGDQVFAGLGYSAIARIAYTAGAGEVAEVVPVSGYPSLVRFGTDTAYFPLGYFGLVQIPY